MEEAFKIVGCFPYPGPRLGFCLPVFLSSRQSGSYIQDVSHQGDRIARFIRLDDDMEGLLDLENQRSVRVGDSPIFVIRLADRFAVGTLTELRNTLDKDVRTHTSLYQAIKWFEVAGTSEDKLNSRKRTLQVIAKSSSDAGERAFTNSLFLNSLWMNILSGLNHHATEDVLEEIHREVLFNADPTDPDIFPDETWRKLVPILDIQRDELRARTLREIPVPSDLFESIKSVEPQPDAVDEQTLSKALWRVRRTPRQEERIAIIMDELISRPGVGEYLLKEHRDRGKMAREAAEIIRNNIDHLPTAEEREIFFAKMVRRLFTMSFAFTRGETLYFLALHLAEYPRIANAIRAKVSQSNAYNVWQNRKVIEEALSADKDRSHD